MSSTGHGILHLEVTAAGGLREFLLHHSPSSERVDFWLHHGCVYVDGVRRREDGPLQPHQIVRLHPNPKSYPWKKEPLRNRIAFDHPEFVALDKPAGLPVHPTLDNYLDNAKYILEQELGFPVYSTHRLDVPTQGLLIFAKTPAAQSLFNKMFAERRVEKIYRARTERAVPLGEQVLYIDPSSRVPRKHSFEPTPGWWECRLDVLKSEPSGDEYLNTIRLITGKTHQIRAQLSALGSPIVGDLTYGYSGASTRLSLECHSLSFRFRTETFRLVRPSAVCSEIEKSNALSR